MSLVDWNLLDLKRSSYLDRPLEEEKSRHTAPRIHWARSTLKLPVPRTRREAERSFHLKEQMEAPTDKPENQSSLSFGWLSFRPRCLQILNTPKWFLFFLSQYFFTQSVVVNGIFPGSISTIERRFGLTRYVYFCEVCSALIEVLLIQKSGDTTLPSLRFSTLSVLPSLRAPLYPLVCVPKDRVGDHETPCNATLAYETSRSCHQCWSSSIVSQGKIHLLSGRSVTWESTI